MDIDELNPEWIEGNWRAGWTLDLHTVSSWLRPDGSFDTERTALGELLYRVKYCYDRSKIYPIAKIAAEFVRRKLLVYPYLSAIIPVPPSNMDRPFQPVIEIAAAMGQLLKMPAPQDYLIKVRETRPQKECERGENQLRGAFAVRDQRFRGKYVLLFDDIYRSGETLRATTEVLYKEGGVSRVYVLALTRTRTK